MLTVACHAKRMKTNLGLCAEVLAGTHVENLLDDRTIPPRSNSVWLDPA